MYILEQLITKIFPASADATYTAAAAVTKEEGAPADLMTAENKTRTELSQLQTQIAQLQTAVSPQSEQRTMKTVVNLNQAINNCLLFRQSEQEYEILYNLFHN